MAKRKSDASQMIDKMIDLVDSDTKNDQKSPTLTAPEEPEKPAKLEDILEEINNMVDSEPTHPAKRPQLARLEEELSIIDKKGVVEGQKVQMPRNRVSPLKEVWEDIYGMVVKQLKLEIRFNTKTNNVEIRKSSQTTDPIALQRATDFLRAFAMGFELGDAKALIRIDELYLESFKITDIKQTLKGDHLARAIGRIAGSGGRNKHTIENATKTRIVLADSRVSILGSFQNCRTARRAICAVVMGTPNNKIHGTLRQIAERMGDRY